MEITNENYEKVIEEQKNVNILVVKSRCARCPAVKAWWSHGPVISTDDIFEPEDVMSIMSVPSMLMYRDGKLIGTYACESQEQVESIIHSAST